MFSSSRVLERRSLFWWIAMTVRDFLTQHDLAAYADAFEAQQVTLAELLEMTDEELKSDFGLTIFGDRKRFKGAVAGLSSAPAPSLSGPTRFSPPTPAPLSGATRFEAPTPAPLSGATRFEPVGPTRVDAASALPDRLGSYRVLGLLGVGGMGTVVRARHTEEGWAQRQGGDVAIKLIHPQIASDATFRDRFFSEAELGRRVQHPGLVPTFDVIAEGAWLGTVMSLVVGEPLTNKVVSGGLPVSQVVTLLQPVAEALDYLHGLGIVHRDLKPANIMVRVDGRPVVLDLGIAKDSAALENHTRTMMTMGTSAWMAPEQADAKHVDGAADRYALGMIAYALLAGRLPWEEGTSEVGVLVSKMTGKLVPLAQVRAGLPEHVVAAVMKMVSVDAGARYATCAAFVVALRNEGAARAVAAAPAPPAHGQQRAPEHHSVAFDHEVEVKLGGIAGLLGGSVRRRVSGVIDFSMGVIPACTFTMGSPVNEADRQPDETPHEVRLTRGYALGTTPVTQALWAAVMGSNPSSFKLGVDAPQRPVEQISWFDAVRFCNALSEKARLRLAYTFGAGPEPVVTCDLSSPGFRLPTEAEWECAARAGTSFRYSGSDNLGSAGWFKDNSDSTTHPVGQKQANAWGLHDMSGNVWEWCWDVHCDYKGLATDPTGASTGSGRVIRGGSWDVSAQGARVARRPMFLPANRYFTLGLRLARTIR